MLVSHDRALLRSVCDEFWMVSRGGVSPFDGDLDDYQRYLLDEAKRQREQAKQDANAAAKAAAKAATAASGARKPARSGPSRSTLQMEIGKLEARMQELGGEAETLTAQLGGVVDPAEIADLGLRLQTVNDTLRQVEERWLELSNQLETSTA
jgi:ATP-binding cassette subfamily F protein 3